MQSTKPSSEVSALYDPAIPIPKVRTLTGREQDLARIKQRLHEAGHAALTVLHGLPGVGKTALATALAHDPDIRAYFSGGVLWAGLGPNPNIPALLSRWAGLLGLSPTQMARLSGTQAWASAIRNAIGSRKMIIIIDDVWQYEDVQALRVGAQNCAHLVTTRHRAIAAQMTPNALMISELNEAQSTLLLNRTMQEEYVGEGLAPLTPGKEQTHVGRGLAPLRGSPQRPCLRRDTATDDDGSVQDHSLQDSFPIEYVGANELAPAPAQRMQDLVQAVGGLPLALTLLGNYLRKQAQQSDEPISAALERLSNVQLRLQISEPHTTIEDHPILYSPSLQSIIAITDKWLPQPAREALYTLSIFPPKPHTFTEEAALAVTAKTYNELDILSDVGLLETNGDRCTLHQLISDYAHIHLHETDEREAHSRLITYIADYVEAHKKDYELLDLESHTIHLVLSQAHAQGKHHELIRIICAFAPFLILRGQYLEAQRHLQRANQAARTLNDNNAITATLLYLGEIEQRLGNYPQAENSLQEGLTLARQMNNNERICPLLTQLGIVFQEQGHFQQAETAYQEGLTLARNIADPISIGTLLDNLGWLIMKRGEFAQSESYLQEGLTLARRIDDRERVGGLLRRLGVLEFYRGKYVQAQSYLQEGLTLARKLGDSEQICALLINLGLVAFYQGINSQAKMYYQEGLELARQIGHREKICSTLINLGDVFVEEGNYVQAETYFQEGLELARQIGHREGISILLLNLGMTARKQGHYNEAKPYLQESLALANQVSRPRTICHILCELGDLSLSEGDAGLADDYFRKMLEMAPADDQELLAFAYYGLARVCALQGDGENARLYSSKSITIFEAMEHRNVAEVRDWIKSTLG
jgi:tetratricopeptide (TPR) repeat protein